MSVNQRWTVQQFSHLAGRFKDFAMTQEKQFDDGDIVKVLNVLREKLPDESFRAYDKMAGAVFSFGEINNRNSEEEMDLDPELSHSDEEEPEDL